MKTNPLVSVIIPTKNSAEFIGKCLRSIVKQSYKNIEIIVVDNYSTDKTREIVESCHLELALRQAQDGELAESISASQWRSRTKFGMTDCLCFLLCHFLAFASG